MRKGVSVLLILCLFGLFGCSGKEKPSLVLNDMRAEGFDTLKVYLSEMVLSEGMPQTQKLTDPFTPEGIYFLARLNQIVKDLGFKITFEAVPLLWPDSLPDYTYKDTLVQYAPKLKKGDTAILFPQANSSIPGFDQFLLDQNPSLVRRIGPELWAQYAPQWYAENREYIDEYPYAVPTSIVNQPVSRPVLAVRDGIAEEYGREINTLNDYEAFLRWCKEAHPDMTPSLIVTRLLPATSALYQDGSYLWNARYMDEGILSLIFCELTGYPVTDSTYAAPLGIELTEKDGIFTFLPVEQDPKFADAMLRLLRWRDEGLVTFADLSASMGPSNWEEYASASMSSECWTAADYIKRQPCGKGLCEMMNQTPYILNNGLMPDLRSLPGPYALHAAYLGVNASDAAAAEWLSFLEYLHANQKNLRSLLWGEEGVEYTLTDGAYEALSYPKPDDLDDPYSYDFRYDFGALQFFSDARFPAMYKVQSVDTSRMQNALDALTTPEAKQSAVVRGLSRTELHDQLDALQGGAKIAVDSRCGKFPDFLRELLKLPASEAEQMIKDFAMKQEKNCAELIPFFTSAYRLGEWNESGQTVKTD